MNNPQVDKDGAYIGPRPTYRAAGNVVAAAGTSAFLTINGAAGKVIRISKIRITGITLTAVQYLRVALNKNSTAFTGGTSTNPTKVPLDSNSPASSATIAQYTVAPAGGTVVGSIGEKTVLGQASTPAASASPNEVVFDFTDRDAVGPGILRSAAEGISVLFAAAPASAVTLSYDIEYTEDGN